MCVLGEGSYKSSYEALHSARALPPAEDLSGRLLAACVRAGGREEASGDTCFGARIAWDVFVCVHIGLQDKCVAHANKQKSACGEVREKRLKGKRTEQRVRRRARRNDEWECGWSGSCSARVSG